MNNPLSFADPLGLFGSCPPPNPGDIVIDGGGTNPNGTTFCPTYGPPPGCWFMGLYEGGFGGTACSAPPTPPCAWGATNCGPQSGSGGAANNGNCGITVKCRGIQTDNLGKIGMQHCDAQVTTSSGQLWSLSGGPQPNYMSIKALNAWATSPPTEPFTGTTVYQGNSCTAAGCMVQATQAWNQDIVKPEYGPVSGPNSNTWLKGTAAGCGVSLPINTWGSIW